MILDINDKNYIARYNIIGELIINLNSYEDVDKLFFIKWCNSLSEMSKVDYVKDIMYEKVGESGVLKHCFPIMSKDHNEVKIVYDKIIFDK